MSSHDGPSFVSRLLAVCLTLLVAAIFLSLAVWLLERIWGWLVLFVALVVTSWIAVRVWRWRQDRW